MCVSGIFFDALLLAAARVPACYAAVGGPIPRRLNTSGLEMPVPV